MQSHDPQHFFESDAAQSQRERRDAKSSNKYGNPIRLKSKILAAIPDPSNPTSVLVAESAGSVRRVNLKDEDTKTVFRGPTAPVTCVAVGGPDNKILFAGSWDKAIWSWNITTRSPGQKYVGHTDFVKTVVCSRIGGKPILISGGADKVIIVWDVATGARLHTLQDTVQNMLAVQDVVVDPVQTTADEVYLVSASSDPHIRRWRITADKWEQVAEAAPDVPGTERRTVLEHETTVYKLVFEHEGDEVDLWTSSGDGTAKCLSRLKGFTSDDSFKHGDHVRAVAVTDAWVITAGRDEDIKFWDRATGKLHASLQGHYDEVTDLVVLPHAADPQGPRLCSVSLDGTVRSWSLARPDVDAVASKQKEDAAEAAKKGPGQDAGDEAAGDLMTADEEAELAALMDEE